MPVGRTGGRSPTADAGRLLGTLALLAPVGMGCAAAPDQPGPQPDPELDRPPVVRLLAGTRPEGVLVYEDWVTDGQLHTYEAEAVPADLSAVPWRHGDQLTFDIGTGQPPSWAAVLVHDELPAGRVPDTDAERVQCLPRPAVSQCEVDQSALDSMIRITARPLLLGELIILNVGWELPEQYRTDDPQLPPYVSASWAFAAEPASEPAARPP